MIDEDTVTATDMTHLARAVEVARASRESGNHPFGAVLADADGTRLLEAGNTVGTTGDVTGHAETNLVRLATTGLAADVLAGATLFTTAEPCAMCTGALYWSGIGRLVYAVSEARLRELTGVDPRNPTLDLPCRDVFAAGQRPMRVAGPVVVPGAEEVHAGFWDPVRPARG